ncbi:MAG: 3-oxoacyl-ACP synthase [Desulfobacterales bacterium SG8_35]|jgi:3-oxoacyl-[acyl-carrier-protein] synthase III|nr:MAG: 3-oxoacyl-ACP synthase [Desulfobacterales bacterium SG8_35]
MKFQHVRLHGFGYELPPNIITSETIEERLTPVYERLKLPKGRLELMSGIRERRFWDKGTRPSDAAVLAGGKAIAAAGIPPSELDCLIFTSVSRDMMEPATASFVHNQLGLPERCLVFDISNACLGFLDGMIFLANMIELGQIKCGLLVAGETAEDLLESTIRNLLADNTLTRKTIKYSFASFTIGSGSVALVMTHEQYSKGDQKFMGGAYRANTKHNDLCQGGRCDDPLTSQNSILMATDSEELMKQGIETARATWTDFLAELAWLPGEIDNFFCHQVGQAHARLLFESLEIDPARNFETLSFLGNTGSVSAPATMAMGIEQGVFSKGQRSALLGIGSGINCLMLGVEW